MKLSEMLEIRDSRVNLQAFLHFSEQVELQNLLFIDNVSKYSWLELCNTVLSMYKDNMITNKTVSKYFEKLAQANTRFKIERWRYDSNTKSLLEWEKELDCYLYVNNCTLSEYRQLVKECRYIN